MHRATTIQVSQETRAQGKPHDVASNICQAYACQTKLVLAMGGVTLS